MNIELVLGLIKQEVGGIPLVFAIYPQAFILGIGFLI
jgi:hypothetical protein